jgi:hypothetical protein
MSARTPRWWRALPTWIQLLVLSLWLPGVVAHELTHALAARRWADSELDWDVIGCRHHWETGHPAPRALAAIAPLLLGSALTVGLVATVAGEPGTVVGAGLWAFVLVNLGVYTVASLADLVTFAVAMWATVTGRRYATGDPDGT